MAVLVAPEKHYSAVVRSSVLVLVVRFERQKGTVAMVRAILAPFVSIALPFQVKFLSEFERLRIFFLVVQPRQVETIEDVAGASGSARDGIELAVEFVAQRGRSWLRQGRNKVDGAIPSSDVSLKKIAVVYVNRELIVRRRRSVGRDLFFVGVEKIFEQRRRAVLVDRFFFAREPDVKMTRVWLRRFAPEWPADCWNS